MPRTEATTDWFVSIRAAGFNQGVWCGRTCRYGGCIARTPAFSLLIRRERGVCDERVPAVSPQAPSLPLLAATFMALNALVSQPALAPQIARTHGCIGVLSALILRAAAVEGLQSSSVRDSDLYDPDNSNALLPLSLHGVLLTILQTCLASSPEAAIEFHGNTSAVSALAAIANHTCTGSRNTVAPDVAREIEKML